MTSFLSNVRRALGYDSGPPLRLVVGLNRVDEIVPGGWDTRINAPTPAAAGQIHRKSGNPTALLSRTTEISQSHIEYYSATKRYRLYELLGRVVSNCYGGFKL